MSESGTICLQGGGEFSPACAQMDADLVRRAGGGRVVVTALAGTPGADYRTATANGVRHFAALQHSGLGAIDVVAAPDVREDASGAIEALLQARLIVLPGGSPTRLREALTSTGAGDAVLALLADDGVVMGASAGAMVLCSWMVLPDKGFDVVPGLGAVPDSLVLPHYAGGQQDWLRAIDAVVPPETIVYGLPEESGVVVAGGVLTAAGRTASSLVRTGVRLEPGDRRPLADGSRA